jgi:hypothetical protein
VRSAAGVPPAEFVTAGRRVFTCNLVVGLLHKTMTSSGSCLDRGTGAAQNRIRQNGLELLALVYRSGFDSTVSSAVLFNT